MLQLQWWYTVCSFVRHWQGSTFIVSFCWCSKHTWTSSGVLLLLLLIADPFALIELIHRNSCNYLAATSIACHTFYATLIGYRFFVCCCSVWEQRVIVVKTNPIEKNNNDVHALQDNPTPSMNTYVSGVPTGEWMSFLFYQKRIKNNIKIIIEVTVDKSNCVFIEFVSSPLSYSLLLRTETFSFQCNATQDWNQANVTHVIALINIFFILIVVLLRQMTILMSHCNSCRPIILCFVEICALCVWPHVPYTHKLHKENWEIILARE